MHFFSSWSTRAVNATTLIAYTCLCLMVPLSAGAGNGADSDASAVAVRGAVKSGGEVRWREGMRLYHAIRAAGGMTESADFRRITLTRGKTLTTHDLRIAGSPPDNPVLKAGDQIFVPHWEAPTAKPKKKTKAGKRR
jgi:SLBB domain